MPAVQVASRSGRSSVGRKLSPAALDFFAGSGLASVGLSRHFDVKWANDNCVTKGLMFKANHSNIDLVVDSIVNIRGKDLPNATLSWASFPCQDLSLAGQMAGLDSARSGLVWEWLRVMDEMPKRPELVVAENVVGLVSTSGGKHYHSLHEALSSRGYNVGAVLLDAIHWLPQSRPRIFVVGASDRILTGGLTAAGPIWCHNRAIQRIAESSKDFIWWNLPFPDVTRPCLDELLDSSAQVQDPSTVRHNLGLIPPRHRVLLKKAIACGKSVFPAYKRTRHGVQVLELRFDGIAGCLRTPEGGSSRQLLVLHHNGQLSTRLITIKEASRLMGVRDSYIKKGSYNEGYKAMGDAVAVPAVRYLAKHLLHPLALHSK